MDSDLDSLKDGLHDAELVTIPNGLFQGQSDCVYPVGRKADAREADPTRFDVREVVKTPARVARAASINIASLQRTQVTGIQYPANTLASIDERAERTGFLYRFAGGPPVLLDDPHLKRPKRALTSSYRERRQARKSCTVISPSTWLAEVSTRPPEEGLAAPDGLTDESHIFRDLSSFNFAPRRRASTLPPLFYTRGNSIDRERSDTDNPGMLRRVTTESSGLSPGVSRRVTTDSLRLSPSQDAPTRQMTSSSVSTNPYAEQVLLSPIRLRGLCQTYGVRVWQAFMRKPSSGRNI
jgi:hypothetical protein